MKTIRGVYHDIEESDIYLQVDNFYLYFSSNFLKGKFVGLYDKYYEKVNKMFTKIYDMDYTSIIIISLYKNVEKRGFRVYYNDRRIFENQIRIGV